MRLPQTLPPWLQNLGLILLGFLAAIGLWSLLQLTEPTDPCRGGGTYWVALTFQGLDLCRVVFWQKGQDGLYVRMTAGVQDLRVVGPDQDTLLALLSKRYYGAAR